MMSTLKNILVILKKKMFIVIIIATLKHFWRCPPSIAANIMDCDIVHQLRYYIHFGANTFEKRMNFLIYVCYGLISTTTVLVQGWLWPYMIHGNDDMPFNKETKSIKHVYWIGDLIYQSTFDR